MKSRFLLLTLIITVIFSCGVSGKTYPDTRAVKALIFAPKNLGLNAWFQLDNFNQYGWDITIVGITDTVQICPPVKETTNLPPVIPDKVISEIKDVSVYDQVMAKINRMSDVELVELLDRVDDQVGEAPRKDNRLTFYTTVDYVVEGQYYRDFIQDLSVSGVFIKARQMFEPGQHIMMTFMSPFLQKPFKISGEIVRTLDAGIGVKFDQESQVQAEAISALMDQIRMIEAPG